MSSINDASNAKSAPTLLDIVDIEAHKITFKVENTTFRVPSCIFAESVGLLPVLSEEDTTTPNETPVIILQQISVDEFRTVLSYLLRGTNKIPSFPYTVASLVIVLEFATKWVMDTVRAEVFLILSGKTFPDPIQKLRACDAGKINPDWAFDSIFCLATAQPDTPIDGARLSCLSSSTLSRLFVLSHQIQAARRANVCRSSGHWGPYVDDGSTRPFLGCHHGIPNLDETRQTLQISTEDLLLGLDRILSF